MHLRLVGLLQQPRGDPRGAVPAPRGGFERVVRAVELQRHLLLDPQEFPLALLRAWERNDPGGRK